MIILNLRIVAGLSFDLLLCANSFILRPENPLLRDNDNTEAVVVITATRSIVVPVRNTTVLGVVVPTTTAKHAVRAILDHQLLVFLHKYERSPLVYAFSAKAIKGTI